MAGPFKRVCLQGGRHSVLLNPSTNHAQTLRMFTSNGAQTASPTPTSDLVKSDDPLTKADNPYTFSSVARRDLEQHRELREIARIAAWELPLLSRLAKPYTPPTKDQVLRWRYTTYMGEVHPAARKVVVEFKPRDISSLTQSQQKKMAKLAGPRYNPETKVVRMSCESFETQAQNKRALGDTIASLITECKDPNADTFEDVTLDTRHHQAKLARRKRKLHFPKEWNLTPEKKEALDERRRVALLEEGWRVEDDNVVNGLRAIEEARNVNVDRVEEPIMVDARQMLAQQKARRA